MKCPECEEQGLRSIVHGGDYCTRTLMYCPTYYDEDGKFVPNKCNTCTCGYTCSNGHEWSESYECN